MDGRPDANFPHLFVRNFLVFLVTKKIKTVLEMAEHAWELFILWYMLILLSILKFGKLQDITPDPPNNFNT